MRPRRVLTRKEFKRYEGECADTAEWKFVTEAMAYNESKRKKNKNK